MQKPVSTMIPERRIIKYFYFTLTKSEGALATPTPMCGELQLVVESREPLDCTGVLGFMVNLCVFPLDVAYLFHSQYFYADLEFRF